MAFDFLKIRQTITDVSVELRKLRGEREVLLRKREDLEAAPACKADLLELLDAWVDRKAQDFPQKLQSGLAYYARHPLVSLPESAKAPVSPLKVLTAVLDPNAMATLDGFESSLFYVLRGPILAGLHQAVEQLDFSSAGPLRAERLETIKAIDARIDAIDKAEAELIGEAEKSGLRL